MEAKLLRKAARWIQIPQHLIEPLARIHRTMLLAGACDDLNAGQIHLSGKSRKKQIQRVEPHPRIRVDFTVLSARDESAGRAINWQILAEVHRRAGDDFALRRMDDDGAEGLG